MKFVSSPYSLKETLLWPYYQAFPDITNKAGVIKSPASYINKNVSGDKIKLLFFGDVISLFGEKLPKSHPQISIHFQNADIIIGNLESPITRDKKNSGRITSFVFSSSAQFLEEFCSEFQVDPKKLHLSLANNHIGDHGPQGLEQTLQQLQRLEITPLGLRSHLNILIKDELNISIFAYTQWLNHEVFGESSGVNRVWDLKDYSPSSISNYNLVLPHWGYEFRHFPEMINRNLAIELSGKNTNLIVGHHPHVLQPIEQHNEMLCAYGLGNLMGVQLAWETKLGALLEVELVSRGKDIGKLASYKLIPFYLLKTKNTHQILPVNELDCKLTKKCHTRLELLYPGIRI